jgi:Uma2 family endonuclease
VWLFAGSLTTVPATAPVIPPPLRDGDHMTRDEFLRRWDAMPGLKRAELINGVVHRPSPVSNFHGDCHFRLSYWLGVYAAATPGCMAGVATTWLMNQDSTPQPDLHLKILPELGGQSRLEGPYPAGAPELIVEISHTTSTRESGEKAKLYERSGVREYLIVRPKSQRVVWRELAGGKYREIAAADGTLRSHAFPGLWLLPAALWESGLDGLAATVGRGLKTADHTAFARKLKR